jgi:hypothetical protein
MNEYEDEYVDDEQQYFLQQPSFQNKQVYQQRQDIKIAQNFINLRFKKNIDLIKRLNNAGISEERFLNNIYFKKQTIITNSKTEYNWTINWESDKLATLVFYEFKNPTLLTLVNNFLISHRMKIVSDKLNIRYNKLCKTDFLNINDILINYEYFVFIWALDINKDVRRLGFINEFITRLFNKYIQNSCIVHTTFHSFGDDQVENSLLEQMYKRNYGFKDDNLINFIYERLFQENDYSNSLIRFV